MKKILIFIMLILALSAPVFAADVETLVISNEGKLIDNMINDGYGTSSLLAIATYLQRSSGQPPSLHPLLRLLPVPEAAQAQPPSAHTRPRRLPLPLARMARSLRWI